MPCLLSKKLSKIKSASQSLIEKKVDNKHTEMTAVYTIHTNEEQSTSHTI